MKKLIPLIFLALFMLSCTTKYGKFSNSILKMDTKANHASLMRSEVTGHHLGLSKETGAPEWFIGKAVHTQFLLPKMECTTYFREDGTKEKMICEQMPDLSVEAKADAKGGYVGDHITTGKAIEYASSYEVNSESSLMWIESIKAAVSISELDKQEKEKINNNLSELGKLIIEGILSANKNNQGD